MPASVSSKRVAVIGGGPIGMRAAIMAAEQGHAVTLFEKAGYLGGQLYHSDFVSFKWPLRDYKTGLYSNSKKPVLKFGYTLRPHRNVSKPRALTRSLRHRRGAQSPQILHRTAPEN